MVADLTTLITAGIDPHGAECDAMALSEILTVSIIIAFIALESALYIFSRH
jgi:hypothetical protein